MSTTMREARQEAREILAGTRMPAVDLRRDPVTLHRVRMDSLLVGTVPAFLPRVCDGREVPHTRGITVMPEGSPVALCIRCGQA